MATKIKSITLINNNGTQYYEVGRTYNDLYLAKIIDKSVEFPESLTIIYNGETHSGELVFEAINCPMDVQYTPA